MRKAIDCIENLSALFMLIGVIAGGVCIAWRYLVKDAIIWGDEASIYIFIWTLYLALAGVTYHRTHLNTNLVELLVKSQKVVTGVRLFTVLLTIAVSVIVAKAGIAPVLIALKNSRFSDSGVFPMAVVYAIIPVAFCFNIVASVLSVFRQDEGTAGEEER
jgi:TRAP-type C4-dicarboxylate transport system permease small subunit